MLAYIDIIRYLDDLLRACMIPILFFIPEARRRECRAGTREIDEQRHGDRRVKLRSFV